MMKNLKIPPELKGLKLADRLQSSENLDVDITTGNNYYGQLITAKIIKPENEALIAMESNSDGSYQDPRATMKTTYIVSKDRNH